MSKLKEKYIKVFVEESLNESSQYGIYLSNDEFMQYFVSPFTDVLKAAKLALKDVGSGVLYNMRILYIHIYLGLHICTLGLYKHNHKQRYTNIHHT